MANRTYARKPPRLIPDWEKERIVLAWPTLRREYTFRAQNLTGFFHRLLRTLDGLSVPVCLLVPSLSDLAKMRDSHPSLVVEYVPGLSDVWLKDSAPWLLDNGSRCLWQPEYDPPYLSSEPAIRSIRPVLESFFRRRLAEFKCTGIRTQLDWKWEGGNATFNGAGVVIATDAVLEQNRGTGMTLETVCLELGARPVIIPAEPGDVLSHADGTVRFWSRDELLVSDLRSVPGITGIARRRAEQYLDRLMHILTSSGFRGANIHLVPCGPYAEQAGLDGIPSARGCYINYLRTRDIILVPRFGDKKQDRKTLDFFHSIQPPGVKVASIDCRLLSDFGGGLNCLAATY
jgi:agmatine/peptidylarginine deiminase